MSHPKDPRAHDLDEDLFAFAEIAPESENEEPEEDLDAIFASFREAETADELLELPATEVRAAQESVPAALPSPARSRSRPAPARARAKSEDKGEGAHAVRSNDDEASVEPESPERELVPAARSTRFPKGAVAIALAVTVLNSSLALVALRGRSSDAPPSAPSADEHEHAGEAQAAPAHEPELAAKLPDPEGLDVSHAHPTLDQARKEIEHGEYAAARQHVYGLLAIIDRLEDPRREALEADCQFLVAQSLHLEALARMGEAR